MTGNNRHLPLLRARREKLGARARERLREAGSSVTRSRRATRYRRTPAPSGVATGAVGGPLDPGCLLHQRPRQHGGPPQLLEIADGSATNGYVSTLEPTTFTTAKGFADALQANASLYASAGQVQVIAKRFAPAAAIAFDLSQALPPITGATDLGQRRATAGAELDLDVHGGGRRWDRSRALLRCRSTRPSTGRSSWRPVQRRSPRLRCRRKRRASCPPADAGPSVFASPSVMFLEADTLPSYAAFRRQHGTISRSRHGFGLHPHAPGERHLPPDLLDRRRLNTKWRHRAGSGRLAASSRRLNRSLTCRAASPASVRRRRKSSASTPERLLHRSQLPFSPQATGAVKP